MSSASKVVLNMNSITKKISPMIFGSFIEHVGECIHNGVWSYNDVELPFMDNPDLDRVRRDLHYALSSLRPALLRWPGGCYADVYHWKDAIGPRSTRKFVQNKFWAAWSDKLMKGLLDWSGSRLDVSDVEDFKRRISYDVHNQFGTLEFLSLCEEIYALPYINVNYGTGSPAEAADWVEYCNGSPGSTYGALRAMHGRRSPFNVPIWGIGNEIYLENEQGHEKDPSEYGRRFMEFAKKMKEKDPSIRLVGCGWNQENWNEGFLNEVDEDSIDYLSLHQYLPFPTDLNQLVEREHPENESVYYSMMAAPFELKKQILKGWNSIIKRFGEKPKVKLAIDEWGIWYTIHDLVKANYNMQDGLFSALVLMMFQRFSDICPIGLWSMLVNSLGMINTDEDGLVLTPVYHVFKLFKDHTYNNLIENISVETPQFDSESYGQISKLTGNPYVECSATTNDDGSNVSMVFVNKHFSETISVNLMIRAFAFFRVGKIIELSSDSPFARNTVNNRDAVFTVEKELGNVNPEMTLELKPHSITVLKLMKLDFGISL